MRNVLFISISLSPIDVVWEGMNDILSKPFTKTGLFEMLEVNILFEKNLFISKVTNQWCSDIYLETSHAFESNSPN